MTTETNEEKIDGLVERFKEFVAKGECKAFAQDDFETSYSRRKESIAWVKQENKKHIERLKAEKARIMAQMDEKIAYAKLESKSVKSFPTRSEFKVEYDNEILVMKTASERLGIGFRIGDKYIIPAKQ